MSKYIIQGGQQLKGEITVSGAKNAALKAIVAALLTEEKVVINNIPKILDVLGMVEIVQSLGAQVRLENNCLTISSKGLRSTPLTLEQAAQLRTSSMLMVPLLYRFDKASVPNPGGCRIGHRPIDRHIEGLRRMGVKIKYAADGFFHSRCKSFAGVEYTFEKNTHTGTETLILAAAVAQGRTVLNNAAAEPEIDDLIRLLNQMGAKIKRAAERKIVIDGVSELKGVKFRIMSDRNEAVTFAAAALASKGSITVNNIEVELLANFLQKLDEIGGGWKKIKKTSIRFFYQGPLKSSDVVTGPHLGFMTDWQAPWSLLMTQATGKSVIHETVFEKRFGYVSELKKMGAKISFVDVPVDEPEKFYNFNWAEVEDHNHQAILVEGPVKLHNAVVNIPDLRAGATLVLAALVAEGITVVNGIEQIERGYEDFALRLKKLGAKIKQIDGND